MWPARLFRTILRLGVIAALVFIVTIGLDQLKPVLQGVSPANMRTTMTGLMIAGLLLYAVLMAIPFVPGVEVGLSLLMMQGAKIAPFVFLATFSGLTIAFLVGRHLPLHVIRGFFADIGLKRVTLMLDRLEPLNRDARLDLMREGLPTWLRIPLVRYRYLSVALALNIPGNAFVGGGGGIAMLAGLSGLFRTRLILLTFALAVAPVPIAVMAFGSNVFKW